MSSKCLHGLFRASNPEKFVEFFLHTNALPWCMFQKALDVYFRRCVFYSFPFATVMPSCARFLALSSGRFCHFELTMNFSCLMSILSSLLFWGGPWRMSFWTRADTSAACRRVLLCRLVGFWGSSNPRPCPRGLRCYAGRILGVPSGLKPFRKTQKTNVAGQMQTTHSPKKSCKVLLRE